MNINVFEKHVLPNDERKFAEFLKQNGQQELTWEHTATYNALNRINNALLADTPELFSVCVHRTATTSYFELYTITGGKLELVWFHAASPLFGANTHRLHDASYRKYLFQSSVYGMSRELDAFERLARVIHRIGGCKFQIVGSIN